MLENDDVEGKEEHVRRHMSCVCASPLIGLELESCMHAEVLVGSTF
jgi:hypothetical protein